MIWKLLRISFKLLASYFSVYSTLLQLFDLLEYFLICCHSISHLHGTTFQNSSFFTEISDQIPSIWQILDISKLLIAKHGFFIDYFPWFIIYWLNIDYFGSIYSQNTIIMILGTSTSASETFSSFHKVVKATIFFKFVKYLLNLFEIKKNLIKLKKSSKSMTK